MDARQFRRPGWLVFILVLASVSVRTTSSTRAQERTAPRASQGSFSLVTYNVAGLPEGISRSQPTQNIPQIGERLNDYDMALVQEDFAYQDALRARIRHAHISAPALTRSALGLADGLNRFSRLAFGRLLRSRWTHCHGQLGNGADCLAAKGFSVAAHELPSGARLDVYNVHMDAGSSEGDRRARRHQIAQLLRTISARSPERAVIVAGDTNVRSEEELSPLLEGAGLRDTCGLECSAGPGRVDRVLYRASVRLDLRPTRVEVPESFVDASGQPLSDHSPVSVHFRWTMASPLDLPVAAVH